MADPENDIMTLEEVAEYLRLKLQTNYTWAQEKKIPAAKPGKEWLFRRSVVDKWFNQHIDVKFEEYLE
jgi:excisionase family DNA binding protein